MTAAPAGAWSLERRAGTAAALHDPWPEPASRTGRVAALCAVHGRALVLGSTQRPDVVDRRRAAEERVEVVRRRSGGGAVLVAPGAQAWLDIWLPRHDILWDDDVIRSSHWLGALWCRALAALGARHLSVHSGPLARSDWTPLVCFSGVGPGEVTAGAAKVVGVAQRRTREGARFHSVALWRWEPSELIGLLALAPGEAARAVSALQGVATGLEAVTAAPGHSVSTGPVLASVEDALAAALP